MGIAVEPRDVLSLRAVLKVGHVAGGTAVDAASPVLVADEPFPAQVAEVADIRFREGDINGVARLHPHRRIEVSRELYIQVRVVDHKASTTAPRRGERGARDHP